MFFTHDNIVWNGRNRKNVCGHERGEQNFEILVFFISKHQAKTRAYSQVDPTSLLFWARKAEMKHFRNAKGGVTNLS